MVKAYFLLTIHGFEKIIMIIMMIIIIIIIINNNHEYNQV